MGCNCKWHSVMSSLALSCLVLLDVHGRSIGKATAMAMVRFYECSVSSLLFLLYSSIGVLSRSVSASSVCHLLQMSASRSSALGGSLSLCSSQLSAGRRCREAVQGFCGPGVQKCNVVYDTYCRCCGTTGGRGGGREGRKEANAMWCNGYTKQWVRVCVSVLSWTTVGVCVSVLLLLSCGNVRRPLVLLPFRPWLQRAR